MTNGKNLPNELIYELAGFILQKRRWTFRGVNISFDVYVNGRIGLWLRRVNQLAQQIDENSRHIMNFFQNFKNHFASPFSGNLLKTSAEVAMEFCFELENIVHNYKVPNELSVFSDLADILASARSAMKIWTDSAENEEEMQFIFGHMQQFREVFSENNVVRYDEKTRSCLKLSPPLPIAHQKKQNFPLFKMATGIRLPQELLYDLLHFLSRSRRWARCRVNMAFDHHLLKQMGPWLMRVKQLVSWHN
ncbi:hypothetical protein niasHT_031486 [Heterodera trifolii]|uniref:Uncharacterized protein n=1 Tax=Heterodera trifolii TaxID=157864 RepID=A0ABD2J1F8_9BILA